MGAILIVVPLVALVFPILLLLGALLVDMVYAAWCGYRVWHERAPWRLGHLLHVRHRAS
jgi:hypothetical protein